MSKKKVLFQIDQETDFRQEERKKDDVAEELRQSTQSLWESTASYEKAHSEKPEELPKKIPVLIIGGGMAGILTAYQLKQRGVDAIVVERGEVGRTCTAHTTAKITSLHGAIYEKITKAYGRERAIEYYQSQQKAIQEFQNLIHSQNIQCEFERKSHILYTQEDLVKLQSEMECLKKLGIAADWVTQAPLPFKIKGGIVFHDQAQFHPLQFLDQLVGSLRVFPHCQVTRIDSDGMVEVNHKREIKAEAIVIATHYPIINSKGFYFTRLDQERSYVVALQQKSGFDLHDMYIDLNEKGHSFRTYKDLLLVGLGNHRSGKKKLENYYQELEAEAFKWYPNAKIVAHWSNQDCMSVDQIPYIGAYSKALPNIYVTTGFNQWGMSNSMVSAQVISDLIVKGRSEYEELYSPNRHQLSGTGNFIVNGAVSVVHLSKQLLHLKEDELNQIQPGSAGIVKLDGATVGVYKEEQGKLHVVDTKCPHLGCHLEWNSNEKTWDCPCHGSRFDIDGHLIEDPAQKDLAIAYTTSEDKANAKE